MSNKISCPYSDLQAHKCFWKAPLSHFVFIDLLCATWPTLHLLTYFLIHHSPPGMCPCHFGWLSLWFNIGNTLRISLGLWMGRNDGICHDNEGRRGGGGGGGGGMWKTLMYTYVPYCAWWLSWQRLNALMIVSRLYYIAIQKHVLPSVQYSDWCKYEYLYFQGINDVWILNLESYELINQGACKFSLINKLHIFQCMDKKFCVEFQREPLKFHTKYLARTLKEIILIQYWKFKSSQIYELIKRFWNAPLSHFVSNDLLYATWTILCTSWPTF